MRLVWDWRPEQCCSDRRCQSASEFSCRAGLLGVWSVRAGSAAAHEAYLVLTFVSSTHVLALNAAEELDEASAPGFATDAQTLFCGTLADDQAIQVSCLLALS